MKVRITVELDKETRAALRDRDGSQTHADYRTLLVALLTADLESIVAGYHEGQELEREWAERDAEHRGRA